MALAPDSIVVVVGASLAGLRAAETLRAEGHGGPIVVVGAERHTPYDRPPLSKQFLAGTWDEARIALRPPDKLAALGLDLRLGVRAVGLDVAGHSVSLDDGTALHYDGLVVATGARPRTLPGVAALGAVHTLRTLDDARALSAATAEPGTRLVVVGAGFIGAEVAATCAGRGADVTVLEALPVPLGRVLGDQMGAACAALHSAHGVTVRAGTGVAGLRAEGDGRVAAVALADGAEIPADVVVVGIGVEPVTDWLEDSGLELGNGVVADETLHAADDVVVAGDVARWQDRAEGRQLRIEHWTNAAEQGVHAARSLMAGRQAAEPYDAVPYFWSDQYDVKIQVIGHPSPEDEVVVTHGSLDEGRFVAVYGNGGRFRAALGFGRPRQLMGYRKLLEERASFDEALAHDPG